MMLDAIAVLVQSLVVLMYAVLMFISTMPRGYRATYAVFVAATGFVLWRLVA